MKQPNLIIVISLCPILAPLLSTGIAAFTHLPTISRRLESSQSTDRRRPTGHPLYVQRSDALRETALNRTDEAADDVSSFCCAINFEDISAPFVSRLDSESVFIEFDNDGAVVPAGRIGRLKEDTSNFLKEPVIEISIAIAVLVNSLLVAVSTLDSLADYMHVIRYAENFVSILFCVDFVGRWFSSSKEPGRHILDAQFALDVLVVIFPLFVGLTPPTILEKSLPPSLTNPSGLFNLELLRVLRLRRVLVNLSTFEKFVGRALGSQTMDNSTVQGWQLQLCRVLLSLFTLLSVATGLIYTAEHTVNPTINNYFDALYFGLTTLTTVGFGDVTPVTWQGKFIVCGSILVGVAVVPAQAASLVEALLAREQSQRMGMRDLLQNPKTKLNADSASNNEPFTLDTTTGCSSCGATFHWTKAKYCHTCGQPL